MIAPEKLRGWRASQEISQSAAAELVGVSQTTWSAWERGTKRPELEAVVALERVTRRAVRLIDWLKDAHGSTVASRGSRRNG